MENTIEQSKKSIKLIVWGVVVFVLILVILSVLGKYNSLVTMDEGVNTAWSQVENQYQRRYDLIPNIVASVKGETNFEKSTLEAVVQARASATKTTIDVNNVDEIAEFQKEQTGISQALSKLLMITENYPTLKSNQGFSELRTELEGTENRISTERMRYNEKVQEYNVYIRQFPTNLLASIFGFEKKNLFENSEKASEVPVVEFEKMN
ncbi:MAG: LemA family protein [Candidatus Gracilibacteria bacterium]|nr:LemA family protein [Candidatus Gracilibacteria bacterium]